MTIRIIDYQEVDLSADEYREYQQLVKEYTRGSNKGEDYFRGLFHAENGKIIYIKSLGNRMVSMEIIFFIMNIMQNQHLREMYNLIKARDGKIAELEKRLAVLEKHSTKKS